MITQQDNLIIQSYVNVCLATELKNNKFIESAYFNSLIFTNPSIKNSIIEVNIDNQGFFLMAMYAMLVIPHELIATAYKNDYLIINEYLEKNTNNTKSTYASDTPKVNFLRHIRNSIAHARVSFNPGISVTFTDEGKINKKTKCKESFSTDLSLSNAGNFLSQLQKIHIKYIENITDK